MKKFTQFGVLFLAMLFSASSISAQIVGDNFDGWTAGEQLVQQAWAAGDTDWTTWSDAPGTGEDPYVSDATAASGVNSVHIESGNDLVLLLPETITAGTVTCEAKINVPAGLLGYFNILTNFAGGGSEWGTQIYFNGGIGSIDAGAEAAATFSYDSDSWIAFKAVIDMDNDWATVYLDDEMLIEWQWSLGTFGTPGPCTVDAMNFFAWDDSGAGTPGFYIDDAAIGYDSSSEIFEPFEDYNVGDYVVEAALAMGREYWTVWSGNGGAGTSEDGVVSDEQVFEGDKSMLIVNDNDVVLLLGDKTGGTYSLTLQVYIPTGSRGYFNALHSWSPTAAEWALELFLEDGGVGNLKVDGQDLPFSYSQDEWLEFELNVDLTEDLADVSFAGNQLHEWQWSIQAGGSAGVNQLAALDFYGSADAGIDTRMFIDNIDFVESAPPPGDPTIEVDPTSFTQEIIPGSTESAPMTINNVGQGRLDFGMYWLYDFGKAGGEKDSYVLHYDGDNASGIGSSNDVLYEVGAKFPIGEYNDLIGMEIVSVDFFFNEGAQGDVKVRVYGQGNSIGPGELITEQTFTTYNILDWTTFELDTPVALLGGDMWVTVEIFSIGGTYPLGCDAGPAIADASWTRSNGGGWYELSVANPTLPYNWNIRANCSGDPITGWLDVAETSGQIWNDETFETEVAFDATDLVIGTYNADIIILSNDAVNPEVIVPVTLDVISSINENNNIVAMVYPNPATDVVNIKTNTVINSLVVYNYAGQEVVNEVVGNNEFSISTVSLDAGVYILRLETEDGVATTKLIVE